MLVLREYRFLAIVHVGVSRQNFDFIKIFPYFCANFGSLRMAEVSPRSSPLPSLCGDEQRRNVCCSQAIILAELIILINKFSGNIMDNKALLNSTKKICQQFVNTSFGSDLSSNILTYHLCSLTN